MTFNCDCIHFFREIWKQSSRICKEVKEEAITPVHPKAVNRDCDSGDKREGRGISYEEGSKNQEKLVFIDPFNFLENVVTIWIYDSKRSCFKNEIERIKRKLKY